MIDCKGGRRVTVSPTTPWCLVMSRLTIRFDLPNFTHAFIYEGDETAQTKLKQVQSELAAKAGIDLEAYLQSAVTLAPSLLTSPAAEIQRGAMSVITAWALGLPSGHPTHTGTIGEWLGGYDFVVSITNISGPEIKCRVTAIPDAAGTA
jgi:hypothetical protein